MARCDGVLFTYFLELANPLNHTSARDERIHFALSRDGYHFTPLNAGRPIPPLLPVNGTFVRDPFVNRARDGTYHLLATDHANHHQWRSDVLHWSSTDLVHWSEQSVLNVWGDMAEEAVQTWAPEWVWDASRDEYLVFWAVLFRDAEHFRPSCDNPQTRRHLFWAATTSDFVSFSKPFELFDPGCEKASFAPDEYSEGGIDGDIVHFDGTYYLYYKDGRAPKPAHEPALQRTSGVRMARSADLRTWTPAAPRVGLFAGPWGTEGPELLLNGSSEMRLYFDCSFQPTPPGLTRPPFGVARAAYPAGFNDSAAWTTVSGSCTGNDTANVDFPVGATQGSFLCIDEASYAVMLREWPPEETGRGQRPTKSKSSWSDGASRGSARDLRSRGGSAR
jgi:hypothetical protein